MTPVENLIKDSLIPTLFGLDTPLDNNLRDILSLKPCEGGMGLNNLIVDAEQQHNASISITKPHVESILEQQMIIKETDSSGKTVSELKTENKTKLATFKKQETARINNNLSEDLKPYVKQASDKGASSWQYQSKSKI